MFSNTPAAPPPVHKYSSQTTNNSAFNTIMLHKLFNKLRLLNVNPQMCRLIDLGFPSQPDSGSQIQLSLSATTTLDAKYWCTSRVCFLPYCSCSSPTTADPTAAPLWYLSFQMGSEGLITNADESAFREEVEWVVEWCTNNDRELNVAKTKGWS